MADSWSPSELGTVKPPRATSLTTQPTGSSSWAPSPIHLMSDPRIPDQTPQGKHSTLEEGLNLGAETLPVAGGMVGSLAGLGGTAALAGTGSVLRNLIQAKYNEEPTPGTFDNALTFAKNAAYTGMGGRLASEAAGAFENPFAKRLASALSSGIFSQGVKAVEGAASGQPADTGPGALAKDVGVNLGFDLALSPFTWGAGRVIDRRANKAGQIPLKQGVEQVRQDLDGTPQRQNAVELGTKGRTSTIDAFEQAGSIEKAQYDRFNKHRETAAIDLPQPQPQAAPGDFYTKPGPAKPPVRVEGPIYTNEATMLAGKFKPTIDALMRGKAFEALPEDQKLALRQVDNLIDVLTTGTPTVGPDGKTPVNLPVLNYEAAKQIKTSISQNAGSEVNKSFGEGGLVALVKALDKDIDASVLKWPTGQQAKTDLEIARNSTKFKEQVWSKEIKDRMYGKNERTGEPDDRVLGDPSQFFADAYSSPEKTARAMKGLGPGGIKFMRQNYFDNVLSPKIFGSDYTKFNPRILIEDFQSENSSARTLYSPEQRNNAIRFFKAAETSPGMKDPAISFQGRMLGLATGALTRLGLYSTGAGGAIAGTAGTGARIGVEEFIHAGMDKPELFEYASRLVKIKADSQEGQLLMKKLMRGLRGSMVTVNINGKDKEGEVQETGRIKFN